MRRSGNGGPGGLRYHLSMIRRPTSPTRRAGTPRGLRGTRMPRAGRPWPLGAALALVAALVAAVSLVDGFPTGEQPPATAEQPPAAAEQAPAAERSPATAPVTIPTVAARSAPPGAPVTSGLTIVPDAGSGTWARSVDLPAPTVATGTPFRVAVRVEDGLPVAADTATAEILAILGDERGWQTVDGVRFEPVADPAAADAVISIASPDTVDALCAPLNTGGEVSCRVGTDVVLNAKRWLFGVEHFPDLATYRQYVVNHEVGHALGHGHVPCPAPGAPADLMQQQTGSLDGCTATAWPSGG